VAATLAAEPPEVAIAWVRENLSWPALGRQLAGLYDTLDGAAAADTSGAGGTAAPVPLSSS
jgi:hypothetical protein